MYPIFLKQMELESKYLLKNILCIFLLNIIVNIKHIMLVYNLVKVIYIT